MQRMIAMSDIVKLSDADLAWFDENRSFDDQARDWLGRFVLDDPNRPAHRTYKVARWTGDPADSAHVDRTPAELAADPLLDPLAHHSWSEYMAGAAPSGALRVLPIPHHGPSGARTRAPRAGRTAAGSRFPRPARPSAGGCWP